MKMYLGLTKRNMLVYFKDRQAIMFSLLTSIILFVLYLLFLRGTFVDAINQALASMPMIRELVRDEDLEMFTNIKLLVGIIGSAAITVPFSCLRTVTADRESRVDQDILATPVSRGQTKSSPAWAETVPSSRVSSSSRSLPGQEALRQYHRPPREA